MSTLDDIEKIAPPVLELAKDAIELIAKWANGNAEERAAAEAQATAARDAMENTRKKTAANHEARLAELDKVLDDAEKGPLTTPVQPMPK